MQLAPQTAKIFMDYLKDHGYPENSINAEYQVGEHTRVDIVILDPDTKTPIQIFEIKKNKTDNMIKFGKGQIQKAKALLKAADIPAYLVFPSNDEPYFEVMEVKKDTDETNNKSENDEKKENTLVLNYPGQKNARLSKVAVDYKEKQKKVIDYFKISSWILAGCIFILGLLSKLKIIEITATDLTLIGAIIALILIPFSSKLKFLGIEFERLTKK